MPQARYTALARQQKNERRGTNKDTTNATYETTDAKTKKICIRRTNGTVSRKTSRGGVGGRGRGEGLNSSNYKYIFGPHRGAQFHL